MDRFERFKAGIDYSKVEAEIRPIVERVNACPWLLTIQSCQGHAPRRRYMYPYLWVRCISGKVGKVLNSLECAVAVEREALGRGSIWLRLSPTEPHDAPLYLWEEFDKRPPRGGLYVQVNVEHSPYTDEGRRAALAALAKFAEKLPTRATVG